MGNLTGTNQPPVPPGLTLSPQADTAGPAAVSPVGTQKRRKGKNSGRTRVCPPPEGRSLAMPCRKKRGRQAKGREEDSSRPCSSVTWHTPKRFPRETAVSSSDSVSGAGAAPFSMPGRPVQPALSAYSFRKCSEAIETSVLLQTDMGLIFICQTPKRLLGRLADRTMPVVGQIFEFCSRRNLAALVAPIRVVDISAVDNLTAPHILRLSHNSLLAIQRL